MNAKAINSAPTNVVPDNKIKLSSGASYLAEILSGLIYNIPGIFAGIWIGYFQLEGNAFVGLLAFLFLGLLVGSVISGILIKRFSCKSALLAAAVIASIGLLLVATIPYARASLDPNATDAIANPQSINTTQLILQYILGQFLIGVASGFNVTGVSQLSVSANRFNGKIGKALGLNYAFFVLSIAFSAYLSGIFFSIGPVRELLMSAVGGPFFASYFYFGLIVAAVITFIVIFFLPFKDIPLPVLLRMQHKEKELSHLKDHEKDAATPFGVTEHHDNVKTLGKPKRKKGFFAAFNGKVWILLLCIFLYTFAESIPVGVLGNALSPFARDGILPSVYDFGIPNKFITQNFQSFMIAIFWTGLSVGRFFVGLIKLGKKDAIISAIFALGAFVFLAVFVTSYALFPAGATGSSSNSDTLAPATEAQSAAKFATMSVFIFFIGLGFAPVFTTLLTLGNSLANFETTNVNSAFIFVAFSGGIFSTVINIGSLLAVLIIGVLALLITGITIIILYSSGQTHNRQYATEETKAEKNKSALKSA